MYDGTNFQLINKTIVNLASEVTGVLGASNGGVAATSGIVGTLGNFIAKTYFNMQLTFTLWTGSTSAAATTDFPNWIRGSADPYVTADGTMVSFTGTGADSIYLTNWWTPAANSTAISFANTNTIILDWFAILPSSSTGDMRMGLQSTNFAEQAYNAVIDTIAFTINNADNKLYAVIGNSGTSITTTDISAGLTTTNWNNYRIETTLGSGGTASFYVNGVLKATLSGANFPTNSGSSADVGFGRSNTALFRITAPNLGFKLI